MQICLTDPCWSCTSPTPIPGKPRAFVHSVTFSQHSLEWVASLWNKNTCQSLSCPPSLLTSSSLVHITADQLNSYRGSRSTGTTPAGPSPQRYLNLSSMEMLPLRYCQCLMLSEGCHWALSGGIHVWGEAILENMTGNTDDTQTATFMLPYVPYEE